jgi:hypothetical protein
MPAAAAQPAVTAWEIPTYGRPGSVDVFKGDGVPAAATAVRVATPLPGRRASSTATVYFPPPDPEMDYFARRHAYAYISPDTARPAQTRKPSSAPSSARWHRTCRRTSSSSVPTTATS